MTPDTISSLRTDTLGDAPARLPDQNHALTCKMYTARTPSAEYTQKEESAGSTVVALIKKATTSVILVTVMETPAQKEHGNTTSIIMGVPIAK